MKKTIVVLLALLLVASLLPAAMARGDRTERLKRISEAKPDTKVLSPPARLGKQAAERKRVADFRKTQTEKANTVPQTVVSEKPKMTEVKAPVGSQERRKQLIEVQKQRIKASREKRLASAGVLATY